MKWYHISLVKIKFSFLHNVRNSFCDITSNFNIRYAEKCAYFPCNSLLLRSYWRKLLIDCQCHTDAAHLYSPSPLYIKQNIVDNTNSVNKVIIWTSKVCSRALGRCSMQETVRGICVVQQHIFETNRSIFMKTRKIYVKQCLYYSNSVHVHTHTYKLTVMKMEKIWKIEENIKCICLADCNLLFAT